MATYVVANAPDTSFNGTYLENGTSGGAPLFQKGTTREMRYATGNWFLDYNPTIGFYYYAAGTVSGPPSTGWVDDADNLTPVTVTLQAAGGSSNTSGLLACF